MFTRRQTVALSALTLVAGAGLLFAGPLSAPVGPITGTYKTLTEVEPRIAINAINTPGTAASMYRITVPGSYYLTGNMAGQAGKSCIEVAISNATIDLNGYTLQGTAGTLEGIRTAGAAFNHITIRNGTINGFALDGIDLTYNGLDIGTGALIEGVRATNNGGAGIRANRQPIIRNCSAVGNTDHGVSAFEGAVIESCAAAQNGTNGIFVTSTATISRCSAIGNAVFGIDGGSGSTISECTASTNGIAGIILDDGSTVSRCASYANSGIGISANASTVADCTVKNNVLDGIHVINSCVVRGNNCLFNGLGGGVGASIRALGGDNRIESNQCRDSDFGVRIDGTGNIVVRNTCGNNSTNWQIVANNHLAPVVLVFPSPAVAGDVAVGGLGSTDPNANFTY
jgi:hypothetical protein